VSERKLTSSEIQFLKESLSADYKKGDVRLREGEYQYDLAKAIASFHLELSFPDVKEIIKRLYGEEKTSDIQFIRKIQTILKKMEKSNIVRILPKKKPWDLQRYGLSSFRFEDIDNNPVIFATEQEIKQAQNLLRSILDQQGTPATKPHSFIIKTCILVSIVLASYATIIWDLMRPTVSPIVFVPAFSIAVAGSLMLGKVLSRT
jgi:hypothetical protein